MTFTINSINVIDDLIEGSLNIQDRCDTSIAQGTCQLYTNKIVKNIPPYTLCSIDGVSYFISSEATQDMINAGYWTHDCTILELTAILQCYILGTKRFSASANHQDGDKIAMIARIIESKYGNLTISTPAGMTSNHEFNFGPGTTVLQALTEIMTWYNYRPKVTSVTYGTTTTITISKISLDGNQMYPLDSTRLMSKVYRQNVDDYGAILESEMQNVVDRTDIVTFKGLTCRSEDYVYNSDNAVLLLPTRVEEIRKLTCKKAGEWSFDVSIVFDNLSQSNIGTTNWNNIGLSSDSDRMCSPAKTWLEWRDILINSFQDIDDDESTITYICDKLWEEFFEPKDFNYDSFKNTSWYVWNRPNASNGDTRYRFTPAPTTWADDKGRIVNTYSNITANLELNILEKGKWELLEAKEKPKYAVYESGSNVISNLYQRYNSNIWTDWLGSSVGPVIKESLANFDDTDNINIAYTGSGTYLSATCSISIGGSVNYNPIFYTFDVECVPITNPIILDIDLDSTPNETNLKKFAKSYELSASMVSFDNVIDNIGKTNHMLGQPEVSIEYDITELQSLPGITNKVQIDNNYFYIMSITTEIHRDYKTAYINLCSSYSKIADAIGVESQYQSTRLPIDEVIERPIYIKGPTLTTNPNMDKCMAQFTFYKSNNDIITKVIKRVVKMRKNNKIYFYVEAYDNYSFDKRIRKTDGTTLNEVTSTNYACEDIRYGDSNNESWYVDIKIYDGVDMSNYPPTSYEQTIHFTSTDISDVMPSQAAQILIATLEATHYFDQFNLVLSTQKKVICKDPREKLTFTIICDYTG